LQCPLALCRALKTFVSVHHDFRALSGAHRWNDLPVIYAEMFSPCFKVPSFSTSLPLRRRVWILRPRRPDFGLAVFLPALLSGVSWLLRLVGPSSLYCASELVFDLGIRSVGLSPRRVCREVANTLFCFYWSSLLGVT